MRKDGTEVFNQLYAYGSRSFSIWSAAGELVFDSKNEFEQITAAQLPELFNANNDDVRPDRRSDDKGPEPEGAAVARASRTS